MTQGKRNQQPQTPKDNPAPSPSGGPLRPGRNEGGANHELLDDLELAEAEDGVRFYPSPHHTQVGSGPYAHDIADRAG